MTATKARAAAKTILLLLGLAFGSAEVAARVAMLGASLQLLLYAALYGILAACLLGAAFIQSSPLRWAWATISLLTALLVDGFQAATAKAMSYDAFVSMLDSAGFLDDAFAQHGASIAHAAAGAFLLFFAIGVKPGPSRRILGVAAILAPFAGLTILTVLLFFRGGEGARGLPAAAVGTSYATLYAIEAVAMPVPPRQPVRLIPKPSARQGDIVLIVDESIAARYLDINDTAGVRSGLLSPPRDVAVSNFGVAASITNCSYGSNLTLRHGGTRGKYQRLNAAMPSIFAYARTAGFRTTYIDAQRTGGSYQNGMDDAERQGIDHFVQFDDVPVVDRDMAAADALIALLNNGRRDFVLINKMGAHFPVADKYPASVATFQPALPRGETVAVTEMKLPENLFSGAEAWRLYRNSYRNTVAWTVGAFFDRILAGARLDGALIVYTSDHGQNLHERGDPGTTTHCSPLPASEEGAVPLVVIGTAGAEANRWNAAAKQHFDASSHYRIFPTLLAVMGYDPQAVGRIYGETLDASGRDPTTFNSLFNARLGRKPIWVEVRRSDVPRPPAGDFAVR